MKRIDTLPVLELRGVHKTYRLGTHVVPALRGVDLVVQPGELLALTGPSGSGKSTLLNLAGLIDTPDQGEVLLRGRSVAGLDLSEATLLRRDAIGFVFQSFNLVPVMTAADNVDYPLFLSGVAAAERRARVMQMLTAVGLHEHAHHRPDALSGGQRQRGDRPCAGEAPHPRHRRGERSASRSSTRWRMSDGDS